MEVAEEDEQQNTNDTIPITASSERPLNVQLDRNEYLRRWQSGLPSPTHTTSNARPHNHLSCSPSLDILDIDADHSVAFLPTCSRDPPSPPATIGALDRDDCSSPADNVTPHQPSWTSSFPIRPSSRYASLTLQDNVAIPLPGQAPAWSILRMQPRVRRPIQIRSQSTCNICNAILGRDASCHACGHALNVTPSSATSQPITRYTLPSTRMNTRQELGNYDILPIRDQYPLHAEIPAVLTLVSNEGHLEWSESEPGSGNPEEHEAEELERALQTLRMKMRKTSDQIRRMDSDRERYTALQKCHKCCTSFLRTAPDVCLRCRHVRCAQCSEAPVLKHKSSKVDLEQGGLAQKVSSDAIRRVYRRPRLRVRYTCDHCGTPFTVAPVCIECGHHRCGSCFRNPPRAPILAHGLPGQITTTLLALERLAADAGRTRSSHSDRDEFLDTG